MDYPCAAANETDDGLYALPHTGEAKFQTIDINACVPAAERDDI